MHSRKNLLHPTFELEVHLEFFPRRKYGTKFDLQENLMRNTEYFVDVLQKVATYSTVQYSTLSRSGHCTRTFSKLK